MTGSGEPLPRELMHLRGKGQYAVAFLDILGFSARLEAGWGTSKCILPQLFELKDLVRFNPAATVRFSGYPAPAIEVRTISDSIVVVAPAWNRRIDKGRPDERQMTEGALVQQLATVMATCGVLLAEGARRGLGIRGAIEVGPLLVTDAEIIGPAFGRAYNMESKAVGSSRVLLGPGFCDYAARLTAFGWSILSNMLYRTDDGHLAVLHNASKEDLVRLRTEAGIGFSHRYDEALSLRETDPPTPALLAVDWQQAAELMRQRLALPSQS